MTLSLHRLPLQYVLLALCLVAGLGVAAESYLLHEGQRRFEASSMGAAGAPVPSSSAANSATVRPLPVMPALSHFAGIAKRPLFLPDRRPPVVVKNSTEGVVLNAQFTRQWRLTGIVITPDQTYAVLQERKSDRSVALGIGMAMDGWVVSDIGADRVTLVSGTGELRLTLHEPDVGGDTAGASRRARGAFRPQ